MAQVPDTITFASAPLTVGRVAIRTSEEEMRMTFAPAQADRASTSVLTTTRSRRSRREQVLAVRGPVAERMRVTFIEDATTVETNGAMERTVGPLVGTTVEVERKDPNAAVAVFDASGAPARFGVAAQVAGQHKHFGRPLSPERTVPSGPQRIGDASPEIANALAAGFLRGATVTSAVVPAAVLLEILRGPDGSLHGVYRVDPKVTGSSGGATVTMTLTGTVTVRDADGEVVEVRLQGAMTSSPDGAATGDGSAPSGAGEFKLLQTTTLTRA